MSDATSAKDQVWVGPQYGTVSCTDNLDGTFTCPTHTFYLRQDANHRTRSLPYEIEGATFDPPYGKSYLVADYNGGTPVTKIITDVELITESDVCPAVTVYRDADDSLHLLDWDGIGSGMGNRLHQRTVKTKRFERESGLLLTEFGTRNIAVSAGKIWYGANRVSLDQALSTTDLCELWYHVSGTWTKATTTQYNNSQYDDGTDLVALTGSHYTVNWVFRGIEYNKHIAYVLGNDTYSQPAQAEAAKVPDDLPDLLQCQFKLVGRIVVANGDATATSVTSAFDQVFSGAASADHEALGGLLGAVPDYHFHFAKVETIAEAEALPGGVAGSVLFVDSTDAHTFYHYAASTETRDGRGILNTAEGGDTRWIGFAGRWQVPQYDDLLSDQLNDPQGATGADIELLTGFSNIYARAFNGGGTTEAIDGVFEILHGYKSGTVVWPHIHWSPSTAASGNVRWEFIYTIARSSGEFSAETTLVAIDSADGLGSNGRCQQQNLEFPTGIPVSDPPVSVGDQIRFRLRRVPSDATDTYGADAFLLAVGIHYQMDSIGSIQRFTK